MGQLSALLRLGDSGRSAEILTDLFSAANLEHGRIGTLTLDAFKISHSMPKKKGWVTEGFTNMRGERCPSLRCREQNFLRRQMDRRRNILHTYAMAIPWFSKFYYGVYAIG